MTWTLRLVDYLPFHTGWAPALPDGTGFMLLAAPGIDPMPWGLFLCDEEVAPSAKVRSVTETVSTAVERGTAYPPALALARDEMTATFSTVPTDQEFCQHYVESVERHLKLQSSAPYLLAEAAADDGHYLTKAHFYWVLRYLRGSASVRWVSSDYFVYQNPADDFVLTDEQLDSLLLPFPVDA